MSKNLSPPETYPLSSSLLPGPNYNYVISSFIISLPAGENIAFQETIKGTTTAKISDDDVAITKLTFIYQAFNDKYFPAQELHITHPKIFYFPVEIEILVKDIGGGGTSTVKDVVLPD